MRHPVLPLLRHSPLFSRPSARTHDSACCAADPAGVRAHLQVLMQAQSEIKLVRVKVLGWFVNVRIFCENGISTSFDSESFELEINGRAGDTSGSGFVRGLSNLYGVCPKPFSVLGDQVSPVRPMHTMSGLHVP